MKRNVYSLLSISGRVFGECEDRKVNLGNALNNILKYRVGKEEIQDLIKFNSFLKGTEKENRILIHILRESKKVFPHWGKMS